jgi:hypothetical protein
MHSSLIGKIEKARRYALEKDRVTFESFSVAFRGENATYAVTFDDGRWSCSCDFFAGHRLCCHTMAMEKILTGMMAPGTQSRESIPVLAATN